MSSPKPKTTDDPELEAERRRLNDLIEEGYSSLENEPVLGPEEFRRLVDEALDEQRRRSGEQDFELGIDRERLAGMIEEGYESLEKEGPVSGDEYRRIMDARFRQWAADRKAGKR